MNTTGCPENFATDGAFQPGTPGACETNLIGFYVFAIGITAGAKLISAAKQFSNWLRRPTHRTHIPRGPLNSFVFGIILVLLGALVGADIINYKNGFTFSLFSIGFMNFVYSYSLGLKRLVSLGEKILPKSSRGLVATNLATFDGFGKVMFTLQTVSAVGSSIVMIILSPILLEHELVLSRVGFGTKGMFMAFCIAGYTYQFQRCINTIRLVEAEALPIRSIKSDMEKVVWKMRGNQIVHIVAGGPVMICFFLLAFGALPANVFVLFYIALGEALGSLAMEFAVRARGSKSENSRNKSREAEIEAENRQAQIMAAGIIDERVPSSVHIKSDASSRV